MGKIITSVGDYTIRIRSDPYQAIIESIVNQQLSGKAAESIYNRLRANYQNRRLAPEAVSCTPHERLRSFGLSSKKIEYITLLSNNILDRKINLDRRFFSKKSDQAVIDYLTKIKGIGVWTAQLFLIFCLRRPDVCPVTDIGIKRAVQKWYFPNSKNYPLEQEMMRIAEKWKPFRSVASWYLWKSNMTYSSIG
jgi:DNA-3-methyladenine glycosylase II